jgi:hypothetical protein
VTVIARGSRVAIAGFRTPSEPTPIFLTGTRRTRLAGAIHERMEVLSDALLRFEQEWSVAAMSIEYVSIVPSLPGNHADDLAMTETKVFLGEVFSRVYFTRMFLTDPRLDQMLEDWHIRGDTVSHTPAGLFWHEAGHVLLNTLVLRAEPRSRSSETAARLVIQRAIGSSTTVAFKVAAAKISRRAEMSAEECVAEAMADFYLRGHNECNILSRNIVTALAELWDNRANI